MTKPFFQDSGEQGTADLTVVLEDLNDNAPLVSFPSTAAEAATLLAEDLSDDFLLPDGQGNVVLVSGEKMLN